MLNREDLLSLEKYAEIRPEFRANVMAHKKNRQVLLGDNVTLYFEDNLTMQYQIQEMLRIEKIFESSGIQEELDTYNPLTPDGNNLKATFMIEYPDIEQRKLMLEKMLNIEETVWMKIEGFQKVYAIADEDLERNNDIKTSAVHFLRFEFSRDMVKQAKQGASISIGIDHEAYRVLLSPIPENIRNSLLQDFSDH